MFIHTNMKKLVGIVASTLLTVTLLPTHQFLPIQADEDIPVTDFATMEQLKNFDTDGSTTDKPNVKLYYGQKTERISLGG